MMDTTVAKIIAIVALLVLSLLFGILPYFLLLRKRTGSLALTHRRERIIKFFNCFAGGVFLGALLLDLMVEAAEVFEDYKKNVGYDNDYPFFNVIVIVGFFLVAVIEYVAHSCLLPTPPLEFTVKVEETSPLGNGDSGAFQNSKSYGSTAESRSIMTHPEHLNSRTNGFAKEATNSTEHGTDGQISPVDDDVLHGNSNGDENIAGKPPPPTKSPFQTLQLKSFLLLLALSFHSIFDGLALGLQETVPKIWQIFAAVGLHKSVVSFCLGLDIFENSPRPIMAAAWMGIFATISPIGACIGLTLTSTGINETAHLLSSSILQGLACGAFLYITFLEILNSSWKSGGHRSFLDIIAAFIGFTIMAVVKIWD